MNDASPAARALPVRKSGLRVDIQVLRAVAVLSVIAGHFWPGRFPGGFVGVDVFFVISGFLITTLIVNEVERTGRLSLVGFWARRIRRIMPAALTVIAAVAVTVITIGSPDQIAVLGRHVIASALSAENLLLAQDAVDYDRQGDATSALQHFWSLAVEEQFYLVWPLVVGLVLFFVGRRQRSGSAFRKVLGFTVLALTIASLVYALTLDLSNASTYFDPFARAWELGVGATIAVFGVSNLLVARPALRIGAAVVAWSAIVVVTFVPHLSDSTPGLGVLLPVVATGFLIALELPMTSTQSLILRRVLGALVWVGDRSYSMYLWHWPALILGPFVVGSDLSNREKLLAILAVVLVSALSYRYVEQPFRQTTLPAIRRPRFLVPLAIATTAAVIAGTLALVAVVERPVDPAQINKLIPQTDNSGVDTTNGTYPLVAPFCVGAGAAVFECETTTEVRFGAKTLPYFPIETPTCEITNKSDYYGCVLGDVTSRTSIAVIGDSHAKAMWVTLDDLGNRIGAAVHTYFLNGCAYRDAPSPGCAERNRIARERIFAHEFEFVIFIQAVDHRGRLNALDAYEKFEAPYSELQNAGVKFAVVKDNPGLTSVETECQERNFRNPGECAISRDEGLAIRDYAFEAATDLGVPTIDFTDIYCDRDSCPLAIGGVRVYRDYRHITTVFGKTLGPFLYNKLVDFGFVPRG